MALFSWRRRRADERADLRSELIACVARKDLRGLADRVREQRERIVAEFGDWMTVPMAMKDDPQLLTQYGEMLMAVARIIEREGDASLVARLEGDPADSPVAQWNERIAVAATLSEQGRYREAAHVLTTLAQQLGSVRGSAVDFYRPRVLGKLGIALYRAGDAGRALEVTREARDMCQRLGDDEGVTAYETSLANIAGD